MARRESLSSSSFKYDVFLSFRGEDTRYGFTGHLYKALCNRGIRTFKDDKELKKGEKITPALKKAIKKSRIAIIVFSKKYAFSSFCLEELVHIFRSIKEKGRLVLPVFYDVDPSDVRKHKGTYGEALTKHEERFKDDMERLHKWKMALREAADLCGFTLKIGNKCESEFIEEIVEVVSHKINSFATRLISLHKILMRPRIWRFVTVDSLLVGFVYLGLGLGLSSSLYCLIRKWILWKIFVYVIDLLCFFCGSLTHLYLLLFVGAVVFYSLLNPGANIDDALADPVPQVSITKEEEEEPKNETEKEADDGGAKKDDVPVPVVYKMNCTCEGCLEKINKTFCYFYSESVKIVEADRWANELTVTSKMDSNKLRDKLADITKKNVEIVSPQPKQDASAAAEKPPEKKSDEKKPDDEENKPKEHTVVLKIKLHCDGCVTEIRSIIQKFEGVHMENLDLEKGLVTVKGTMNEKELISHLKKHMKRKLRNVEVVPPK
ncbi:uncharacterized protein LOC133312533 isoform X2 [Gastrolobium bilobum]|uniref:uncharacterized protein LOC133312533 isoform X2 n=1 Tax=Gastrolobium bilobum TaxID=150636 RepID=UPI002AB2B591|nr:uncharacterized protein LOC133312533 isoform X2 [Gastrolobium bilobum]